MKKIEKMLRQEAVTLSNNPEISGKVPTDILICIRFKDGHLHHVFPPLSLARRMILDASRVLNTEMRDYFEERIISAKKETEKTYCVITRDKMNECECVSGEMSLQDAIKEMKCAEEAVLIEILRRRFDIDGYRERLEKDLDEKKRYLKSIS